MKRALIDPVNHRVCEVIDPAVRDQFEVAPPLFWINAADNVAAESHFYDAGAIQINPSPTPAAAWSPLAFMERFTKAERTAIRAASAQDADLADWLDLLRAATEVKAGDQRLVDGMAALVGAGLLSETRKTEILS